jgi:hypothetical protein
MAANPKPIRKLERNHFHDRKYLRIQKQAWKDLTLGMFKKPDTTFILHKRKPVAVNLLTWGMWMERSRARIVKQTLLPEGVKVSTVFLGINHGYGGQVLLFETMIFRNGEKGEAYCDRYETYDQALEGHQHAIEEVFKVGFDS